MWVAYDLAMIMRYITRLPQESCFYHKQHRKACSNFNVILFRLSTCIERYCIRPYGAGASY
jgi:hypothetical protein